MTRWTTGALVLTVLACGAEEAPDAPPMPDADRIGAPTAPGLDERGRLTLDSLGVLATYGMDETAGQNAILQKPIDAAFLGDHVLVLDASAPWVRRFELDGRFDSAMVRQGEGPGEASRPYALAATDDGFLLSHSQGIERFDASGELVTSTRNDRTRDGAIECDGDLLASSSMTNVRDFTVSRALVRLGADGVVSDTLAVHGQARISTRDMWTWFADVRDGTLLFYTEEQDRPRLERRSCAGGLLGELALDSIGAGLTARMDGTSMVVTTARAPHPSGLARVLDRTLWATRRITPESDSITMLEAFDSAGAKRRLALDGWYQLFDADAEGRLLVGNTWTLGFNWLYGDATGGIPAVHMIDGRALVAAVDAHGSP